MAEQDINTKDTLTIDEFAGEESCYHALVLPCRELVLRGKAKTMFAEIMAKALNHPNAYCFFNKWPVIKGYKTAAWDEGDMLYLGMAGSRVWFGGMQ